MARRIRGECGPRHENGSEIFNGPLGRDHGIVYKINGRMMGEEKMMKGIYFGGVPQTTYIIGENGHHELVDGENKL